MSNLALWSRPAWDTDRWLRDFFGPAARQTGSSR